jgi:hypothetical protein
MIRVYHIAVFREADTICLAEYHCDNNILSKSLCQAIAVDVAKGTSNVPFLRTITRRDKCIVYSLVDATGCVYVVVGSFDLQERHAYKALSILVSSFTSQYTSLQIAAAPSKSLSLPNIHNAINTANTVDNIEMVSQKVPTCYCRP